MTDSLSDWKRYFYNLTRTWKPFLCLKKAKEYRNFDRFFRFTIFYEANRFVTVIGFKKFFPTSMKVDWHDDNANRNDNAAEILAAQYADIVSTFKSHFETHLLPISHSYWQLTCIWLNGWKYGWTSLSAHCMTAPYKLCVAIIFSPNSTNSWVLNIALSKVWLQRRLTGVKGVEEGDRISPLECYWQLQK